MFQASPRLWRQGARPCYTKVSPYVRSSEVSNFPVKSFKSDLLHTQDLLIYAKCFNIIYKTDYQVEFVWLWGQICPLGSTEGIGPPNPARKNK